MESARQKKIAMINDLSGYGRCSLTVAIPVISAMKVQCCPVPTSILSNHTGYPSCFFDDYTDRMPGYIEQWKKLGFSFDGIMTGFLGSREQIEIVTDFIRYFKRENTVVLVDPIMGDHGEAYATYTPQMCEEMKELVQYAGIVTPNVTEACLLTETVYSENFSRRALTDLSYKILLMGPRAVIITGIVRENRILNLVHEQGKEPVFLSTRRVGHERPGTGDIFAAVVGASVVRGQTIEEACRKAGTFVKKCIQRSEELEIPIPDGVCFEECLSFLMR